MGGRIPCGEVLVVSPLLLGQSLTRTSQGQSEKRCLPRELFMPCPSARCCGWNHHHQTHWDRHWAKNTALRSWVSETAPQTLQLILWYRGKREGYSRGLKLSNCQTASREFQKFSYLPRFHCISSCYFSHFPGQKMRVFECKNRTQTSQDPYCIIPQFFSASPVLVFTMEKFILRSLPSNKQYLL